MESTKRQLANKNEESVICKPMVWVDVVYIFAVSLRDEIKILVDILVDKLAHSKKAVYTDISLYLCRKEKQ